MARVLLLSLATILLVFSTLVIDECHNFGNNEVASNKSLENNEFPNINKTCYQISGTRLVAIVSPNYFRCYLIEKTENLTHFSKNIDDKSKQKILLNSEKLKTLMGPKIYKHCKTYEIFLLHSNVSKIRKKRSFDNYKGRVHGQTQSQYLSLGNGNYPGKAEAEATFGSSKAIVSGSNGIGSAQSQSSSANCEGCYYGQPSQEQTLYYGRGSKPETFPSYGSSDTRPQFETQNPPLIRPNSTDYYRRPDGNQFLGQPQEGPNSIDRLNKQTPDQTQNFYPSNSPTGNIPNGPNVFYTPRGEKTNNQYPPTSQEHLTRPYPGHTFDQRPSSPQQGTGTGTGTAFPPQRPNNNANDQTGGYYPPNYQGFSPGRQPSSGTSGIPEQPYTSPLGTAQEYHPLQPNVNKATAEQPELLNSYYGQQNPYKGKFNGNVSGVYQPNQGVNGRFSGVFSGEYSHDHQGSTDVYINTINDYPGVNAYTPTQGQIPSNLINNYPTQTGPRTSDPSSQPGYQTGTPRGQEQTGYQTGGIPTNTDQGRYPTNIPTNQRGYQTGIPTNQGQQGYQPGTPIDQGQQQYQPATSIGQGQQGYPIGPPAGEGQQRYQPATTTGQGQQGYQTGTPTGQGHQRYQPTTYTGQELQGYPIGPPANQGQQGYQTGPPIDRTQQRYQPSIPVDRGQQGYQPGMPAGQGQQGYQTGTPTGQGQQIFQPGIPIDHGQQRFQPGIPIDQGQRGYQTGTPTDQRQPGYQTGLPAQGQLGYQTGLPAQGQPGYQTGNPTGLGQPGYQTGTHTGQPGYQTGLPTTRGQPGYQTGTPIDQGQQGYQTRTPAGQGQPGYQTGLPTAQGQPGYQTGTPTDQGQQGYQTGTPAGQGQPGYQTGLPAAQGQPGYQTGTPARQGQQGYQTGIPTSQGQPGYGNGIPVDHRQPGYQGGIPATHTQPGYQTGPNHGGYQTGIPSNRGQTDQLGFTPDRMGQPGIVTDRNGQTGSHPYLKQENNGGVQLSNDDNDADSQAQAIINQLNSSTEAKAQAQGYYAGGIADSHVSGSYSGSGSFSASAGTIDAKRGAQTLVSGGKEGAISKSQGIGGKGRSQAQIQVISETGDTISDAQSSGFLHGTNSKVVAGSKGGSANAQSTGQGSTASQAQIGFTPHDEENPTEIQSNPFNGGGVANAQSGSFAGMSQSQLHGKFRHGIKYTGNAQAQSGNYNETTFSRNRTRFSDFSDNFFSSSSSSSDTFPNTKFANNNNEEQTLVKNTMHTKKSHVQKHFASNIPQQETSTVITSTTTRNTAVLSKDYNFEEEYEEEVEDYEEDIQDAPQSSPTIVSQNGRTQRQNIILDPLNDFDASIIQSAGDPTLNVGSVLQPGQEVPGTNGYKIPNGFRGRVTSVANENNALAFGQNSQAQSVSLRPGNGKIEYKPPTYSLGFNTQLRNGGRLGVGSGYTYQPITYQLRSGDHQPNFVSVTKSESGSKDIRTGKKKPSLFYTQSSTCGFFTNTCVVKGDRKICFPKPKVNPDGTPIIC